MTTVSDIYQALAVRINYPVTPTYRCLQKIIGHINLIVSLANTPINTKFILLNHKGTDFSLLKKISITSHPDIILITSEDYNPNITDYFAGANVAASLIIEDSIPNLKDIIFEARANGLRKIITFGTSEIADVKTSEYANNRSKTATVAILKALE